LKLSIKHLMTTVVSVGACLTLTAAEASLFAIDEFTVTRNGSTLFQDTFDNGVPENTGWFYDAPANTRPGTYTTLPTPLAGPETGGKLSLNPLDGVLINSSLTGRPIMIQSARLNTNTSNSAGNLGRGIKDDDTFSVQGVFDLVNPSLLGERFGVRLTDRGNLANSNGNDVVEVDVRRRAGGVRVEFREQDRPNNTNIILDSFALTAVDLGIDVADFGLYDQIVLILDRLTTTSAITGRFQLIDTGGVASVFTQNFSNSSVIFEGVDRFTQAEFLSVSLVPVPQTALLLGIGLLGLRRYCVR